MNNLSARALAIIEILKKLSHPVSSLALSEEIGCSTKTIQSEIKDINKQLKDTKIVSIRGVGYKLEGKIEVDKCINNNIGNIDRIEFIKLFEKVVHTFCKVFTCYHLSSPYLLVLQFPHTCGQSD